jgi:Domain of unknown function (DUF4157)
VSTRAVIPANPAPAKSRALTHAPASLLQRKCECGGSGKFEEDCEDCKKKKLQRRAIATGPATAPPIVHDVLRSAGRPLDEQTRSFFEPRFGHDFSQVRIHTDSRAAESARSIKALAYASGQNLVFASGQFAPDTKAGQRLLAHELTHVVQQSEGGAVGVHRKLEVGPANDALEQEADRFAEQITSDRQVTAGWPTPPSSNGNKKQVQRAMDGSTSDPARPAAATVPPNTGLIVEDEASEIGPGQMRKSEFLDGLHDSVCATADSELASVGRTAQGCPFIERWIAKLRTRNTQYIERAIRKYSHQASASTAREYFAAVGEQVRHGVRRWASTGDVSGVPPELMAEMAGGGVLGAIAGVMSGIGSALSGAISSFGKLFAKAQAGGAREGNPAAVQMQLHAEGAGRALNSDSQARMESAFGHSFSRVRIHTGSQAAQLSSSLNARALTIGSDIVFAAGEYRPGTLIGDALLAHELAHVRQQEGGTFAAAADNAAQYNRLEEDADTSAVDVLFSLWTGTRATLKNVGRNAVPRLRSGLKLQRCSKGCDKGDRESMTKINLCCTDDMMNKEIKPKLAEATGKVDSVLGTLRASPKSLEAALKANFAVAPEDAESVGKIVNMLDLMSKEMKGKRVKFLCRDTKDAQCQSDKPGRLKRAETTPLGSDVFVKLCANYEMAAFYGGQFLQSGNWVKTLIHEYAHVAGTAQAGDKSVSIAPAATEFYKDGDPYPQQKEKNLGNADSYAWFVMDAASGAAAGSGSGSQPAVGGSAPSKFAGMTPWQLSQAPDSEFSAGSADAGVKQQMADYERTKRLALALYKDYGIKFDMDSDKARVVGREPTKEELAVLDKQLASIVGLPGVTKALGAQGARPVPGGAKPTLQGKVSIATTPGEYGIKRYQLELAITSGFGKDTSTIDNEVRRLWASYKISGGAPTDQERHLAMFAFFANNPIVPGFYSPLDDMIHLSHFVDLKKTDDVEVARHETLHLIGGRDKTRQAFVARYGQTDYIRHWCIFEEGTAQLLTLESAPPDAKKPATAPNAPAPPPTKQGESTVEVVKEPAYQEEVKFMKDVLSKAGRDVVLEAYFSGVVPEKLFQFFDKAPTTACGQR